LPLLHNLTGHTVRLQSVRWVNQPAAAHIISVYAYRYADIGYGIIGAEGNLPIACPDKFKPAPVTAARHRAASRLTLVRGDYLHDQQARGLSLRPGKGQIRR
jgi:hypothetical protein